jgi:hypothetical protein
VQEREEGEKHQVREGRSTAWWLRPSIRAERRGSIKCKERWVRRGKKSPKGRKERRQVREGQAGKGNKESRRKERKRVGEK